MSRVWDYPVQRHGFKRALFVVALHFLSCVSLSVRLNLSFSSADGSVAARPNQARPRSSLNFHSISDRPVALVASEISVTGELVWGVAETICLRARSIISAIEAGFETSTCMS